MSQIKLWQVRIWTLPRWLSYKERLALKEHHQTGSAFDSLLRYSFLPKFYSTTAHPKDCRSNFESHFGRTRCSHRYLDCACRWTCLHLENCHRGSPHSRNHPRRTLHRRTIHRHALPRGQVQKVVVLIVGLVVFILIVVIVLVFIVVIVFILVLVVVVVFFVVAVVVVVVVLVFVVIIVFGIDIVVIVILLMNIRMPGIHPSTFYRLLCKLLCSHPHHREALSIHINQLSLIPEPKAIPFINFFQALVGLPEQVVLVLYLRHDDLIFSLELL